MSLKSILAIAVAAVAVSANQGHQRYSTQDVASAWNVPLNEDGGVGAVEGHSEHNPRYRQSTIDETWGVKPPHQQEGESVWQKYAKNPDIPTLQKAAHDKYAPILRKHLEKAEDLDELTRKAEQLGEHAKNFFNPRKAHTKLHRRR